ncbi:hypothetical protein M427DRAFT_331812 [Gonapodya prolifera JEL478]|uniref:Uncharacterized protein n=1 Tax=Gonapodya prolifera (strain JEL478) TaxID=1344416 RepID=A0A139AEK3_GONPJ|nr:hypothetical protein M427DRAFT_331812 [Gonapodya prolifera JEL478]|eukprot:KXS15188.1 hypothetical protein M427DRAFT_331812 [Gonapodya prolifera JEL478]
MKPGGGKSKVKRTGTKRVTMTEKGSATAPSSRQQSKSDVRTDAKQATRAKTSSKAALTKSQEERAESSSMLAKIPLPSHPSAAMIEEDAILRRPSRQNLQDSNVQYGEDQGLANFREKSRASMAALVSPPAWAQPKSPPDGNRNASKEAGARGVKEGSKRGSKGSLTDTVSRGEVSGSQ